MPNTRIIKELVFVLLIFGHVLYFEQYKAYASDIAPAGTNPPKEEFRKSIEEWLRIYCSPERYGRKGLLKKGYIQFAVQENGPSPFVKAVIVLPERRPIDVNGFYMDGIDCFEGAYALEKALQARGYEARICRGRTDLWENHFYVEVAFGGEWMRVNTAPGMPHFDFAIKKDEVLLEGQTETAFKLNNRTLGVGPALTPMESIYLSQGREIIITASMEIQAPGNCIILCQASVLEDNGEKRIGCATLSVPIENLPKLQEEIKEVSGLTDIPGLTLLIDERQIKIAETAKNAIYEVICNMVSQIDTNSLDIRISQIRQNRYL
jgi:hypothetical protein